MDPIIDAAYAERLLRNALGGNPELSEEQFADLLQIAADEDSIGEVFYDGPGLNRAAATGWSWKMSLQAEKYDLGGGQGRTLDRSQWFAHCEHMRGMYASGAASVIGGSTRRSGIGSIGLTTVLSDPEGLL